MKREDQLKILKNMKFSYIWAYGDYIDDTESPLWVNEKGFGYLNDDELYFQFEHRPLTETQWVHIKTCLENGYLCAKDLEGTTLLYLYEEFSDEENQASRFMTLLNLSNLTNSKFYSTVTLDEILFFDNIEELSKAIERDYCHYEWDELTEEELSEWIEILSENDYKQDLFIEKIITSDEISSILPDLKEDISYDIDKNIRK